MYFSYRESVAIYLRDIKHFSPLSADEEAELARTIREGKKKEAEAARKQLTEANLKFVVKSRLGIDCPEISLGEIATVMGVSHERTRQIYNNAMKKLRMSPYSASLTTYLAA